MYGSRIWPREFIETWQSSSTIREVRKKLGMSAGAVRLREQRYRERGVPLKELGYTESWEWLAEHAKKLGPKDGK